MQPDGYLIVQTFERRYSDYDRPASSPVYGIPIKGQPGKSSAKQYRGVDRRPLSAVPHQLSPQFRQALVEPAAQDRLNRLEERGLAADDLIRDLQSSRWVMEALQQRSAYELIGTRRSKEDLQDPDNDKVLGWDVAYADGDHYSAIANCMFFPSWGGN